jgi:S-adenosylmethionine decarboxylase
MTLALGAEWLVDAHGCDPSALRSQSRLEAVFDRIVDELGLGTIGRSSWHVFPGPAGITGLWLLTESHLTCHTFPERGFAAFNLYCCRPRGEWPWADRLAETIGARDVRVRFMQRGEP